MTVSIFRLNVGIKIIYEKIWARYSCFCSEMKTFTTFWCAKFVISVVKI